MKKKNVYIDIRHLDYWWGVHNFKKLTDWEDVFIFVKWGKGFRKIAWTCLCSKSYYRNCLKDLIEDKEESQFIKKIEQFLNDDKIYYHYYYDTPEDKNLYEVPYEAERNIEGIKPSSIETWVPSEGIDKRVIDIAVKEFCEKFLNMEADLILYKDEIGKEKAEESYIESVITWEKCSGIYISENVIVEMKNELGLSEEKVVKTIERSMRG